MFGGRGFTLLQAPAASSRRAMPIDMRKFNKLIQFFSLAAFVLLLLLLVKGRRRKKKPAAVATDHLELVSRQVITIVCGDGDKNLGSGAVVLRWR